MSPRIDETLRSLGYKGIPLPDGKKSPPPFDWQRIAGTVEISEGSNYGISTEDFVVIDIDRSELVKRLLEKYREQITMLVGTPRGGVHAYFAGRSRNQQNNGWDVRATGGYCLGPGSLVGTPYKLLTEWVPKPELKPVPQELIAKPKERVQQDVTVENFRRITRAKMYAARVVCIEHKRAHNTLFRLCCWMRDIGLTQTEAFAVLLDWNHTNCFREDGVTPFPWSYRELSHKLEDSFSTKGA